MSEDEEIAKAILDISKELGWTIMRLAYEGGVSEAAAKKWDNGGGLSAGSLLRLLRNMPGLIERLSLSDRSPAVGA